MKIYLTIGFILIASAWVLAQPGNPSAPAPIDGGLTILGAAGVTYGVARARKRRIAKG